MTYINNEDLTKKIEERDDVIKVLEIDRKITRTNVFVLKSLSNKEKNQFLRTWKFKKEENKK